MLKETWHHKFRVNVQAEVTNGARVLWPPQSHVSMFKQLHLSELISELVSEDINDYIYPVPIHEYIQNEISEMYS